MASNVVKSRGFGVNRLIHRNSRKPLKPEKLINKPKWLIVDRLNRTLSLFT